MMPSDQRTIQSDTELHVGIDIPRHAAKQIHNWVSEQPWPEGTELEHPKEYHVTLLYSPQGHEQKDAWWIEHLEQAPVKLTGISAFKAQEKGYAYVLLVDSPEIHDKAAEMQGRAEWAGLPITHFDGGYKAHVTVAYGPTSRITGIKAPNFQFDIGPSSVSPPRPKTASVAPKPPHLREGTEDRRCGTCKMFFQGRCWGYGNQEVRGGEVCDSWAPEITKRSAYNPEETQALDLLSLSNVAHNLHYKFEEGGLDPAAATSYAKQLLQLIGYPADELTIQAALQAWQQLYPNDKILSPVPELETTPTVPTKSWGYGTTSAVDQYRVHEGQQTTNANDPYRALMWLPKQKQVIRGAPGSTQQDVLQEFDPLLRLATDQQNEKRAQRYEQREHETGMPDTYHLFVDQPHVIHGTQTPQNTVEWYSTGHYAGMGAYDRGRSYAWHPEVKQVNALLGVTPHDWKTPTERACTQCGGDGWGPDPYHDNERGCSTGEYDEEGNTIPTCGGSGMASGDPFGNPFQGGWSHKTPWIQQWEAAHPARPANSQRIDPALAQHHPVHPELGVSPVWHAPSRSGWASVYQDDNGNRWYGDDGRIPEKRGATEKFADTHRELCYSIPQGIRRIGGHTPLYHWVDAGQIHDWMDESHTGPGQTYLTESGNDPSHSWNPDIPYMDNPVRITIDPTYLDSKLFDPTYEGWYGNHLYQGPIPQDAIDGIKAFKQPDEWSEQMSTVPSQVNDPDDRWPDYGDMPADRKHDVQFSNDWAWHSKAKTYQPQ